MKVRISQSLYHTTLEQQLFKRKKNLDLFINTEDMWVGNEFIRAVKYGYL